MRYFIGILLFFMSVSFIGEQYLIYKSPSNSITFTIDDATDSSDEEKENEPAKEKKNEIEELYLQRSSVTYTERPTLILEQNFYTVSLLSSGYINSPYTPPDLM